MARSAYLGWGFGDRGERRPRVMMWWRCGSAAVSVRDGGGAVATGVAVVLDAGGVVVASSCTAADVIGAAAWCPGDGDMSSSDNGAKSSSRVTVQPSFYVCQTKKATVQSAASKQSTTVVCGSFHPLLRLWSVKPRCKATIQSTASEQTAVVACGLFFHAKLDELYKNMSNTDYLMV